MKCPLSITGELTSDKEFIGAAADCLKEECAWWIPAFQCCAIWELAIRLGSTADELFNIKDIMEVGGKG